MRRSCRVWCDHGVGVALGSPVLLVDPASVRKADRRVAARGAAPVRKGLPWSLPLEDRVLLVAAYWRTDLTPRQLASLFGISKSAAARIIDYLGPSLALQPRRRFREDTALIVEGDLVPTRDHQVAEQSKTSHVAGGSSRR